MKIEPNFLLASVAPPLPSGLGRETPIDASDERARSSPHIPVSPLLAHLAAQGQGGSLPGEDVESLLQLAAHQEVLFQARKKELVVDALRHSPWPALADADPDNAQARQITHVARQLLQALLPAEVLAAAEQRAAGSHSDFFKEIADLIARLDGNLSREYSDLLKGYVEFYRELTDALRGLREQLGTPDKDGNITVNFGSLVRALEAIKTKWASKGFGAVYATKEDADRFLAELGIEGLAVVAVDGGWQIGIDSSVIDSLISVFPLGDLVLPPLPIRKPVTISANALNELMAQKEVMMERFTFINRALPEKYQRQLQMWDSLVKILSSTIDAVIEADRAFIQAMAG